ncbi:MAG: diphthine synthase [Candidatus Micrarchaeaceae archaeon]
MLLLIGLGLDIKDLSVKALERLRDADEILLDSYTSTVSSGYIEFLEKETSGKVRNVGRAALEEGIRATIAPAKSKNIAIIVPGDPLVATTHHTILDEARKMGIDYEVIHAPSAFSVAIGESGLDIYKFGPTATIPFWSEKYKPVSFIDTVKKNIENCEHTLLLLDINAATGEPMEIETAMRLLAEADSERGYNIMTKERKLLILANLGRPDQRIAYVEAGAVDGNLSKSLKGKTISIIIPAKTNFAEEEALAKYQWPISSS